MSGHPIQWPVAQLAVHCAKLLRFFFTPKVYGARIGCCGLSFFLPDRKNFHWLAFSRAVASRRRICRNLPCRRSRDHSLRNWTARFLQSGLCRWLSSPARQSLCRQRAVCRGARWRIADRPALRERAFSWARGIWPPWIRLPVAAVACAHARRLPATPGRMLRRGLSRTAAA